MINTIGLIKIYQGDTIELIVEGLDTSKNYTLYFGVQNKRRVFVIPELSIQTENQDTITMIIPASSTDKLYVPINKDYEDYYYGFKVCLETEETTLNIDGSQYGVSNILRVYPKKVEGCVND